MLYWLSHDWFGGYICGMVVMIFVQPIVSMIVDKWRSK